MADDPTLYVYGANNPIINIDPTGHFTINIGKLTNFVVNKAINYIVSKIPGLSEALAIRNLFVGEGEQDESKGPDPNTEQNFTELGDLSAKHESKGDPGIIANNPGDPGGKSYGAWQLASKMGSVDAFMVWLEDQNPELYQQLADAKKMDGDSFGDNFDKKWKEIAANDKAGFLKLQHDYIKTKYYDVAAQQLKDKYNFDISTKSFALQNVLWSTAVQHGASGAVSIFDKAGLTLDDEQLIKGVYAERGKVLSYQEMVDIKGKNKTINKISGGSEWAMAQARKYGIEDKVMRYFSACDANTQVGVFLRFKLEELDALRMLKGQ